MTQHGSEATPPGSGAQGRFLVSPRTFFLLLTLYFAAHVVLRLFVSPIAELDESWQLVLAQHWSLGYSSHPPLYTWLQIILFKVFGESILTLSLLKNALLFGLFACTYASARLLSRRHDVAVFASMCLFLIPQIAWESQRDLTHSVLLSTTTAATILAFLWLAEGPSTPRYAVLGACIGAVLLSKYNGGVFLLGGLGGALFVRKYRELIFDRRIVATLLCGLAVAGPHFAWTLQHGGEAFASTEKLAFRPAASWQTSLTRLPKKMAGAALPNLISLAVAYVLGSLPPLRRDMTEVGSSKRTHSAAKYILACSRNVFRFRSDAARMLFWGSLISVAILAIGMFAAKATSIRGRWFQPMFIAGPVLLIAQLSTVPRWLFRLVVTLAIAVILTVMIILPLNVQGGGSKNQDLTSTTVTNVLSSAGTVLRQADLLITDEYWIGGVMRLELKKPVVTPGSAPALKRAPEHAVVVFSAERRDEPSKNLQAFLRHYLGQNVRWRVVHLSPDDNLARTGMRVGVAVIER